MFKTKDKLLLKNIKRFFSENTTNKDKKYLTLKSVFALNLLFSPRSRRNHILTLLEERFRKRNCGGNTLENYELFSDDSCSSCTVSYKT